MSRLRAEVAVMRSKLAESESEATALHEQNVGLERYPGHTPLTPCEGGHGAQDEFAQLLKVMSAGGIVYTSVSVW